MNQFTESNHWGLDQPSQELPQTIIQNIDASLKSGMTHYVDVPGIAELRKQVAEHFSTQTIKLNLNQILITAGIQESRFLSLQILTDKERKIGFPKVVHPGVKGALNVRPVTPLHLDVGENLFPEPEQIEQFLEQENPVLFLENPSRFNGAAFAPDTLSRITKFHENTETQIIWDEGLGVWNKTFQSVLELIKNLEKNSVIGELNPGFGLENLQLGYVISSEENIKAMTSLKQVMSICTSTPSQLAAIELFKADTNRDDLYKILEEKRNAITSELNTQKLHILAGNTANTIAIKMKTGDTGNPYLSKGEAFGLPGFTRLSIQQNTNINSFLNSFENLEAN